MSKIKEIKPSTIKRALRLHEEWLEYNDLCDPGQLEKQDSSLFKELIQYWPKINIITGKNFSGTVESFQEYFINNEKDEVKKKKYELTLSYIKAMAELDGFV